METNTIEGENPLFSPKKTPRTVSDAPPVQINPAAAAAAAPPPSTNKNFRRFARRKSEAFNLNYGRNLLKSSSQNEDTGILSKTLASSRNKLFTRPSSRSNAEIGPLSSEVDTNEKRQRPVSLTNMRNFDLFQKMNSSTSKKADASSQLAQLESISDETDQEGIGGNETTTVTVTSNDSTIAAAASSPKPSNTFFKTTNLKDRILKRGASSESLLSVPSAVLSKESLNGVPSALSTKEATFTTSLYPSINDLPNQFNVNRIDMTSVIALKKEYHHLLSSFSQQQLVSNKTLPLNEGGVLNDQDQKEEKEAVIHKRCSEIANKLCLIILNEIDSRCKFEASHSLGDMKLRHVKSAMIGLLIPKIESFANSLKENYQSLSFADQDILVCAISTINHFGMELFVESKVEEADTDVNIAATIQNSSLETMDEDLDSLPLSNDQIMSLHVAHFNRCNIFVSSLVSIISDKRFHSSSSSSGDDQSFEAVISSCLSCLSSLGLGFLYASKGTSMMTTPKVPLGPTAASTTMVATKLSSVVPHHHHSNNEVPFGFIPKGEKNMFINNKTDILEIVTYLFSFTSNEKVKSEVYKMCGKILACLAHFKGYKLLSQLSDLVFSYIELKCYISSSGKDLLHENNNVLFQKKAVTSCVGFVEPSENIEKELKKKNIFLRNENEFTRKLNSDFVKSSELSTLLGSISSIKCSFPSPLSTITTTTATSSQIASSNENLETNDKSCSLKNGKLYSNVIRFLKLTNKIELEDEMKVMNEKEICAASTDSSNNNNNGRSNISGTISAPVTLDSKNLSELNEIFNMDSVLMRYSLVLLPSRQSYVTCVLTLMTSNTTPSSTRRSCCCLIANMIKALVQYMKWAFPSTYHTIIMKKTKKSSDTCEEISTDVKCSGDEMVDEGDGLQDEKVYLNIENNDKGTIDSTASKDDGGLGDLVKSLVSALKERVVNDNDCVVKQIALLGITSFTTLSRSERIDLNSWITTKASKRSAQFTTRTQIASPVVYI